MWLPVGGCDGELGTESATELATEPQVGGKDTLRQRCTRRVAGSIALTAALCAVGALCWWGGVPGTGGTRQLPPGAEVSAVQALVEEDGRVATVAFSHRGLRHEFRLEAASVYAEGAEVSVDTESSTETMKHGPIRTFRAREHGRWANAHVDEDGTVTGLFEHRGHVLRVRRLAVEETPTSWLPSGLRPAGGSPWHVIHHLPNNHFEQVLSPLNVTTKRRLWGHDPEVDTVHDGEWELPDGHDWPDDEVPAIGAQSSWKGNKWVPGCYKDDNELHSLEIGVIGDVKAVKTAGGAHKLKPFLEKVVHQASFIYEMQMNIRLVIGRLKLYSSAGSAPKHARDCAMISGSGNNGYRVLSYKLSAMRSGGLPFKAAHHLFTSCVIADIRPPWSMTVGLAYMNAACGGSYGYGTNMVNGDSTFETFAHELGHNLAGKHSFEEGQGRTGGIMDYGDGKLHGVYQFNTKHRKSQMCKYLNGIAGNCRGKFTLTDSGTDKPAPPPQGKQCKTVPHGKKCVFPFKYAGITHHTCTSATDNALWCATSLYSNGQAKDWGYCRCCDYKTTSGKKCIFPSIYRGKKYNTCQNTDHDHVYCSTKVNSRQEEVDWGNCELSCK